MKKKKRVQYDLSKSLDPKMVKMLSNDELYGLSESIRKEIIDKCSVYGGHLGSNLGVVELMTSLFSYYDFPKDKLILDVGHQCYAQKILSGRTLDNLRQENGVDGFQKKSESIYDCYEAGHSSTSISAAMGMAVARDLNHEEYEVIAFIGDSSIANGLSFEALNNLSEFHHRMIIILNDNEMSITEPTGGFNHFLQKIRISKKYLTSKSKYKNFMSKTKFTYGIYKLSSNIKRAFAHHLFYTNVFEDLGIYYLGVVDGTDINAMKKAFKKIEGINEPILIHVSTAKGKGYAPAEADKDGDWHNVKPFDIENGVQLSSKEENEVSWAQLYSEKLNEMMGEDKTIVSINPAARKGAELTSIMENYPDRYFDVGIAEEHAVVFANGIANNGCHPYVTMYSTFLQRSYDEILHDVARMNLPVTFLVDHSGLVGNDGETHQGIFDVDFMIDMPNIVIAMASNYQEAISLMEFSKIYAHPLVIRYPVGKTKIENIEIETIKLGEWKVEYESSNNKVAVISYGPKIHQIIEKKLDVTVVNSMFLSCMNEEVLSNVLKYENVIIYDPYGIEGGFDLRVYKALLNLGYKGNVIIKAIPSDFIKKGTIEQQEKRVGVDIDSLVALIENI